VQTFRWLCIALLGCNTSSSGETQMSDIMRDVTVSIGVPVVMQVTLASAQVGAGGSGVGQGAVASSQDLEVTGERSEWDLKAGTVYFTGDVVATRGDFVLRTEQLMLTYSDNKMSTAVATGGVVISRSDLEVTGESATLKVSSGEVAIRGAPVVTQGVNRLEGKTVTLFLDDERVVCAECRVQVQAKALLPVGSSESGSAEARE
jgi:lipopolysaccharide export system protein LptA